MRTSGATSYPHSPTTSPCNTISSAARLLLLQMVFRNATIVAPHGSPCTANTTRFKVCGLFQRQLKHAARLSAGAEHGMLQHRHRNTLHKDEEMRVGTHTHAACNRQHRVQLAVCMVPDVRIAPWIVPWIQVDAMRVEAGRNDTIDLLSDSTSYLVRGLFEGSYPVRNLAAGSSEGEDGLSMPLGSWLPRGPAGQPACLLAACMPACTALPWPS